jgi:hypothetical protein
MTYTGEDFERFYIRYQAEAMPRGVSIQTFCSSNGVPFNLFNKWYKDTRHRIVSVQVDGTPAREQPEEENPADNKQPVPGTHPLKIMIDIRMTNGLHIQQRGLSFEELKRLVANLEVLC